MMQALDHGTRREESGREQGCLGQSQSGQWTMVFMKQHPNVYLYQTTWETLIVEAVDDKMLDCVIIMNYVSATS